jgi:mannose-1-phosphate guanylyltransferase
MVVVPVILAGGIGERFWPLSRSSMPKQLLQIVSSKTMLEETLSRVDSFCVKGVKPLIVTGKAIAGKFKTALSSKRKYDLIVEPVGKNTAPAVALAAAWIRAKYGDAVMMVLSADHDIRPKAEFIQASRFAVDIATSNNGLVVFGIKPSRPEVGYGYIQLGKQVDESKNTQCFNVKRFVEKPDHHKAKKFLESGKYMWNSGMFVWRADVILEEFSQYMPDLYKMVQAVAENNFSKEKIDAFYNECQKESVDFGIMEKSQRVFAVVGEFQWDDIGSWESVSRIYGENKSKTTTVGSKIYEKDNKHTIVFNKTSRAVATVGLDNAVVVVTDDAVLVIDRDRLPEIKKYLGEMKSEGKLPSSLF